MSLARIAWLLVLGIALLAGSAQAGRPRAAVLDQDTIAVTHDADFEQWATLTLMRDPSGEALVVESRPNAPIVVRSLGVQVPATGVEADYVAGFDGSIFVALCTNDRIEPAIFRFAVRAFHFAAGDNAAPQIGHWYTTDPNSVRLGIIAILIGVAAPPVETVSLSFASGAGTTIQGWDWEIEAESFAPVVPGPNGLWLWDAP